MTSGDVTSGHASRRRLLAAALFAPLSGCAATPPPRLFTLVPRPGTESRGKPATVMVKPVEVPKYLDRPEIVRHDDIYELKYSEYERWAEGMRDMTTRVLVEDLAMRLPASQVFSGLGPLTLRPAAVVEVEISRFDADPDGAVILTGRWRVQRDAKGSPLRSERIRVPAVAGDTARLVAAMSDALAQLGDNIAAELAG